MLGQVVGPCMASAAETICALTGPQGGRSCLRWQDMQSLRAREGPAAQPATAQALPQ